MLRLPDGQGGEIPVVRPQAPDMYFDAFSRLVCACAERCRVECFCGCTVPWAMHLRRAITKRSSVQRWMMVPDSVKHTSGAANRKKKAQGNVGSPSTSPLWEQSVTTRAAM
eukprot:4038875-Amphidinium_carterae.1